MTCHATLFPALGKTHHEVSKEEFGVWSPESTVLTTGALPRPCLTTRKVPDREQDAHQHRPR